MATNHKDSEAINRFLEQVNSVYKARDIDGFVDCFDDNVVCLPPGLQPIIGKEAWRDFLSPWWHNLQVLEMSVTNHVDIDGNWAIEWHTERQLTVSTKGGDPSEAFYTGMWALYRQTDNSWKIARYCWNSYSGPSE